MKTDLFLEHEISLQRVADELNVSLASVRNWVSAGELETVKRGYISKRSFEIFKKDIVGKTRLVKRANKLHADETNHSDLRANVLNSIKTGDVALETVSEFYETSLGKAYRNQEGIYYTPDDIIDRMFNTIEGDVENLTFFDPCCGSGNYLLGALRRGFKAENIYGMDCDDTALQLAKARIEADIGSSFNNLDCGDFLQYSISSSEASQVKYDVIFTNPPWGKKYQKQDKITFANSFNDGIAIDSSALFTLAILKFCKPMGKVGLLLPDTFCNISAFTSLRQKLLKFSISVLENHKKPFKGLLVGAVSIIFENRAFKKGGKVLCVSEDSSHRRTQQSFTKNPNCIFNYDITQSTSDLIEHLYSFDHVTLGQNIKWGLGIVTGNNKKFCLKEKTHESEPVYRGADILSIDTLRPAALYLSTDFEPYQQVAPIEMYRAKEKLIYKFISNKLCFFHDEEQRLILNSANMLIASKDFPLTMKQLAFLLNSDVMNFMFSSIFRTHKILRSDLQSLPIFTGFFESHSCLNEQALEAYLNLEKMDGTYRLTNKRLEAFDGSEEELSRILNVCTSRAVDTESREPFNGSHSPLTDAAQPPTSRA